MTVCPDTDEVKVKMKVTVRTVEKLKNLLRLKNNLSRGEISEILDAIGLYMVRSVRKNFEVGGRPAWKALKPSTLKRKRGNKILVQSGALSLGILHSVDETDRAVYIGPSGPATKYAARHKFGDEGNYPIPERDYLLMQFEDNVYINSFIANRLME